MKTGFIGLRYEATEIRVFPTEYLFFGKHYYQVFRKCLENLNNHLFLFLENAFVEILEWLTLLKCLCMVERGKVIFEPDKDFS